MVLVRFGNSVSRFSIKADKCLQMAQILKVSFMRITQIYKVEGLIKSGMSGNTFFK